MWNKIVNRLLTVKSIITLMLGLVFSLLALNGDIAPDSFQDIFYIIIAFYFGSSLEKTARANNTTTE